MGLLFLMTARRTAGDLNFARKPGRSLQRVFAIQRPAGGNVLQTTAVIGLDTVCS
jgi:hypothetical protein